VKRPEKALLLCLMLLLAYGGRLQGFTLPDEALKLLAQASAEPCSICAESQTKKAFAMLDQTFAPGTVITADASCRLVKHAGSDGLDLVPSCYPSEAFMTGLKEDEIPRKLSFTFYTAGKKLVGIQEKDLTAKDVAGRYEKAEPGEAFTGRLEIIRYPYGDGGGFNYFRETGRVQIHCRVLELSPAGK
jgi:hypothetical protein